MIDKEALDKITDPTVKEVVLGLVKEVEAKDVIIMASKQALDKVTKEKTELEHINQRYYNQIITSSTTVEQTKKDIVHTDSIVDRLKATQKGK